MLLKDIVKVTARFQRAVRIDADLGTAAAVDGYICPNSSAEALLSMTRHIRDTHQTAFTWTGPYGSGKSSLVVALGSLLSGNAACNQAGRKALGPAVADDILTVLPPKSKGWHILPVVGRRESPVKVIGDALNASKFLNHATPVWTEDKLLRALEAVAGNAEGTFGGLFVFIDEMGKFLEDAALRSTDIYFFQQLAEAACRSNKRLVVVGVLHQSFQDYANRLSRDLRDEWSKIQGRFIDLPVNVAGEEQIEILSRAILSSKKPESAKDAAKRITSVIRGNRRGVSPTLATTLSNCWPLHPTVASLLGSISRRRFGQNQRSLFGFLNSAEPYAFQDFLSRTNDLQFYTLDHLWEYLRINLESSILASPDGHKWAMAVEAIDRCEAQTPDALHTRVLKAIALVDLFKGNSGLAASVDLLQASFPECESRDLNAALNDLKRWSFTIYKGHLNAFAIYAGSDFDIDDAVGKAREEIRAVDFEALKRLAGLQPILAKRHYHETGTLRWFDVALVPLQDIVDASAHYKPKDGAIGEFLLAVPTQNESRQTALDVCAQAAAQDVQWDVVIGLSLQSWTIHELALEILAIEKVYADSPDLGGDSVARREVVARLTELQGQLEVELNRALDDAIWFSNDSQRSLSRRDLSIMTSDLADRRFRLAPKIHNELLNRIRPSSNAIAAQNALLKRMVTNGGEPRLGIDGYPAEGGLLSSILEVSNICLEDGSITSPTQMQDPCNVRPIWEAATKFLKDNSHRTVTVAEIYNLWQAPPFGIRDGLMPVLVVAYILSEWNKLAFYREGIFQSRLRDLDIEVLGKDANAIQLRHINMSDVSKKLLSAMAEVVRELDSDNLLHHLEPIDVARGLIAVFDKVHPWAKKTLRLSRDAIRVRNLFKQANDPNKFLFDDIPALLEGASDSQTAVSIPDITKNVYNGLLELKEAYSSEINRLRELMLTELQVPNLSPQSLAELRARAENIKQVSGDFRLEAFVGRLAEFSGTIHDMEGLASLASSKPPKMWVDNDIDRAKVEITELSQKFVRTETFARVKGRQNKRHALSVVIGIDGRPTPVHQDFEVSDRDRHQIQKLIIALEHAIDTTGGNSKEVVLAALAEVSVRSMEKTSKIRVTTNGR